MLVFCDNRNEVRFFLSTESENRTTLTFDNLDAVDVENPTVVLIHGFTVSSNDSWIIEATAELLDQGAFNVIAVDYTPISRQLAYTVSDAQFVGNKFPCSLILNVSSICF